MINIQQVLVSVYESTSWPNLLLIEPLNNSITLVVWSEIWLLFSENVEFALIQLKDSVCRTTLLGASSRRQDDPTPRRCWTRYTGCPFSGELTTRWLYWLSRFTARRRRPTSIAHSRTERTSTICNDDRPLRRCADRSPRQQWQSAHSAAQHKPSGTRCQRQFWTVTL